MYSAAHTIYLQLMGGGGELVPEEPRCAQRMALSSCLGKASNQEWSLGLPPSEAGKGTAADQTPDAGLGMRGRCWGLY